MNKYKILAAVVATALMSVAGVASAQVAIKGGGASLPADLYKGSTDSILPSNFSYAVTGSGTGKTAFLTNNSALFNTTGTVHFAGSDSVLSATEISTYNTNFRPTYGPILQFPSVATSVTIPFNKAGDALNISDANLCGIFAGTITTWEGVENSGRTGAIQVVYRPESSGTSELLTRFLSTMCVAHPIATSTLKGEVFSVQSTFANLFDGNVVPANFVAAPATGGTSLYTAVYAQEGRIGYVGPDVIPNLSDATKVAKLRDKSPSEVNVSQTLDLIAPPSTAADLADPSKWVPVFTNPSDGYPIAGYTNFDIGQCYKALAVTNQLRLFLQTHYNLGVTGTNDNAVRARGFIPLTRTWREAIRNNLVESSSVNGLGNAATCGTSGRPV
ncbi:substrate-binding domain-containing protein [Stenotrophomonas sp. 278]|uniref:substrate-binding domain-containing protein n=1 Tax=Stenotrophomonas sp. 278 TaxID=2479851 RepID=UPI000F6593AF|nr:substrate-binding domain-containing protein [Stenotrophomonas sp. 278]RRU12282.1 alkaline phosphatase [Stenotrophomonas sp. 278]